MHNRQDLAITKNCACYFCFHFFQFDEIKEWTDQNDTAICPYCSVDTVLANDGDLTQAILLKIKDYWFGK